MFYHIAMKVVSSPPIYHLSGFENGQATSFYEHKRGRQPNEIKKCVKENNSIQNKPATSINFCGFKIPSLFLGGGAPQGIVDNDIPNWARKMAKKNSLFERLAGFTLRKENFFEALVSLGLVTGIKPLFTLFMPGASKDDKEVLAAKHIISGFFGFAMSMTLYTLINDAMTKISENPYKYFKDQDFAKNFKDNLNTKNGVNLLFKKGTEIIIAPFKSRVTIWAVPLILGALFARDAVSKTKKDDKKASVASLSDEEKQIIGQNLNMDSFMKRMEGKE